MLTTRDPKFANTFSEEGDFVVFAKLSNQLQWEISEIKFPPITGDGIELSEPIRIYIRGLEGQPLEEDVRTQISIHKKQTARTDLFGLGAIIYDMLTCGRSPEQFYDLLRVHDRPNQSIKEGLAQRYLHFRNGGGTVPDIDAVFQNLRVDVGSEYPSQGIVNIVLRCMMSRPIDSYYNCEDGKGPWNAVKADLEEFSRHSYRRVAENHLTNPDRKRAVTPASEQAGPLMELIEIQSVSYKQPDTFAKRIVRGMRFFDKVASMIQAELEGGGDFSYLVNVSPANLNETRNQFVPKYSFFESESDIKNLLASPNPRVVLQTFSAGHLLPPFMNALVRNCSVWRDCGDGDGHLIYDPWNTDYGWPEVQKGDRVSIQLSPTEMVGGEVEEEQSGRLKLVDVDKSKCEKLTKEQKYNGMIVRKFSPSDYYVAMLGIYIRLIFFVDPNDWREGTPGSVYRFELERGYDKLRRYAEPSQMVSAVRGWLDGRDTKSEATEKLFDYLACFY